MAAGEGKFSVVGRNVDSIAMLHQRDLPAIYQQVGLAPDVEFKERWRLVRPMQLLHEPATWPGSKPALPTTPVLTP